VKSWKQDLQVTETWSYEVCVYGDGGIYNVNSRGGSKVNFHVKMGFFDEAWEFHSFEGLGGRY
jgi:hypothetical protein